MSMSRREIWESRTRAPLLILAGVFFVAFAIPIIWPDVHGGVRALP